MARASERASAEAAAQRVRDLEEQLARERADHEAAIERLGDRFKVLADEALSGVVSGFREGQEQLHRERQEALDEKIEPLGSLLREYQERVRELEQRREKDLNEVARAAERLSAAQASVLDETRRLNTILGRASHRGRWGEVQLERILEHAGMMRHVDFDAQRSIRVSDESRARPDVVVRLPRGASIAIDAKVPYDAFDRAMSAEDESSRESSIGEFAAALRAHVVELRRRSYHEALGSSPSFTVCFVPSDYLLSVAFEADASLFESSLESNVLIAGPTSLLALLWSAQLGWSQFEAAENIEEIQRLAERLVERTATLYDHVGRLGRSLESSARHYNGLVGSMESSLLATVREIQRHGVRTQRELDGAAPALEALREPDARRWPTRADEGILEAEVVDEAPSALA
jgi:DNA recombination protein RmuC